MAINDWWADDPSERFWLEITYRDDVGGDLLAPKLDRTGAEYWSYTLVSYVTPGDVVLHWAAQPRLAFIGWSFVVGHAEDSEMEWASPALLADERGLSGQQPAWQAPLDAFRPFATPVGLDTVRSVESEVRRAQEELAQRAGGSLYFPFELSTKRPLRTAQGYLTKFPKDLLFLIPGLRPLADLALAEPGVIPTQRRSSSTNTGRQADPAKRKAVENHAVARVTAHLEQDGWKVTNVGAFGPWDLTAVKDDEELHVEVKGSTGTRDAVDLTDGEVRHAETYSTLLAVVDQIQMDAALNCSGGRLRLWAEWTPDRASLMPTAYRYALPEATATAEPA
ncbi:protein NO VEIN domain-containing protein [Catellatospora tritici]|uniref:protein NO VEIN domain-containing protein n=1 Tax=Catellatospora tritici TaxID=2851566 RepID=UPI001C2CFD37|nr:DUF3883 domain-containing protein [Catellatospora tritici]MBV1852036.1 DUF3883 domain-containing protein [Catellatospora tritici]